jgi:hypothetical protein
MELRPSSDEVKLEGAFGAISEVNATFVAHHHHRRSREGQQKFLGSPEENRRWMEMEGRSLMADVGCGDLGMMNEERKLRFGEDVLIRV